MSNSEPEVTTSVIGDGLVSIDPETYYSAASGITTKKTSPYSGHIDWAAGAVRPRG